MSVKFQLISYNDSISLYLTVSFLFLISCILERKVLILKNQKSNQFFIFEILMIIKKQNNILAQEQTFDNFQILCCAYRNPHTHTEQTHAQKNNSIGFKISGRSPPVRHAFPSRAYRVLNKVKMKVQLNECLLLILKK